MPGRAAGLRAMASAAAAVAFPWARPQTAEAMAMEKPPAMATQLTAELPPPCANAGMAKHRADSTINSLLRLPIVFPLFVMNGRQWVVDVNHPLAAIHNEERKHNA